MGKKSLFAALLLFLSLGFAGPASAQGLRLSLDGGASRPLGDAFDQFNWGYSLGANLFFNITDNFQFGGRLAYNSWGPDEAEFLERIDPFDIVDTAEVEGRATAVEVVPAIRLITTYPLSPINFFVHAGAGMYIFNTEITVNGNDENGNPIERVFGDDTSYRFGAQVGAGLLIGSVRYFAIEIFPMLNWVFGNNDEAFNYWSINAGLGIGI
ncbi:hypothetical protein CHISP_3103 [Chitinispirillum alkaliphilum]|nr:hypothetical protein CHISP_3103 [Chitinispirillum alkaliphilum]